MCAPKVGSGDVIRGTGLKALRQCDSIRPKYLFTSILQFIVTFCQIPFLTSYIFLSSVLHILPHYTFLDIHQFFFFLYFQGIFMLILYIFQWHLRGRKVVIFSRFIVKTGSLNNVIHEYMSHKYLSNQWKVLFEHSDWLLKLAGIVFASKLGGPRS